MNFVKHFFSWMGPFLLLCLFEVIGYVLSIPFLNSVFLFYTFIYRKPEFFIPLYYYVIAGVFEDCLYGAFLGEAGIVYVWAAGLILIQKKHLVIWPFSKVWLYFSFFALTAHIGRWIMGKVFGYIHHWHMGVLFELAGLIIVFPLMIWMLRQWDRRYAPERIYQ